MPKKEGKGKEKEGTLPTYKRGIKKKTFRLKLVKPEAQGVPGEYFDKATLLKAKKKKEEGTARARKERRMMLVEDRVAMKAVSAGAESHRRIRQKIEEMSRRNAQPGPKSKIKLTRKKWQFLGIGRNYVTEAGPTHYSSLEPVGGGERTIPAPYRKQVKNYSSSSSNHSN